MTFVGRSILVGALAYGLASIPLVTTAQSQAPADAPPPTVVVAPVVNKSVAEEDQFTGRVQAIQSVDIQARVEGYLEEVAFQEGSNVKTGDLLYQIEQGPYQAALAQAQAQLASAKAQLSSAEAKLRNQEINLQRQQTLVQRDTVSQAVVDDAVATRDGAKADVEAAQAAIQDAQAQIQTAELNLSYTTIKAPIDGRLGRTNVTIGNLVSQGSGTMATLVQLNPIRVAFSVPDTLYTTLVQETSLQTDIAARDLFKPTLQLPNGKTYDQPGKISFASNVIDASTGTITAYADFPNPKAVLLPGAFVVVTVAQANTTEEPVIPSSAVMQDRQGEYVFVLNQQDVVETRRITPGQRTASDIAVTSGLTEGETIVVQGVQKIRPGQKVTPTPLKSDSVANPKDPLTDTDDPAASVTKSDDSMQTLTPKPDNASGSGSDADNAPPASGADTATAPATTGDAAPAASTDGTAAPASPPAGNNAPADSTSSGDDSAAPADAAAGATDASTAPASATTPAGNDAAPADATPADAAADGSAAPADSAASDSTAADSTAPATAESTAPAADPAQPAAASDAADATPDAAPAAGSDATPDPSAAAATPAAGDGGAATADAAPSGDAASAEDADKRNVFEATGTSADGAPIYNVLPPHRPGENGAPAQATSGGN